MQLYFDEFYTGVHAFNNEINTRINQVPESHYYSMRYKWWKTCRHENISSGDKQLHNEKNKNLPDVQQEGVQWTDKLKCNIDALIWNKEKGKWG